MSLSFQELHQLTRAAVTRAEELQVPVVISIVDANGTQTVTGACLTHYSSVANWHRKSLDRRGNENRHA